jgi:threonine dehydratase
MPVHNTASATVKEVMPEDMILKEGEMGTVTRAVSSTEDAERLNWYLRAILTANVYDVAVESSLDFAPRLSDKVGAKIWFKREDLQPVKSFKLRGAYNRMAALSREALSRGVICSSAGNHAQGVALAARELGCDAVIAMPITTPAIKVDAVRQLGATVALEGENYDACQAYAKNRALEEGRTFVPPFDDPLIVAGQGTVGMEILRQLPSVEIVFVPVGGGGLIAGIAAYVKSIRPDVKVIGVEPEGANAMAQSLYHGEICRLAKVDGFADGVAVRQVGEVCFDLCQQLVDGIITVKTDQICAAIKDVFTENRSILEPAGAVSVAGAKAYCAAHGITGDVVAVTSGANMNFDRLRIVSQLADGGLKQEATLVTVIPEENGSFKKFAETVGVDVNFTEFKYRVSDNAQAVVLYSVTVADEAKLRVCLDRLNETGFFTENLTDDETTQVHLRHMVGGSANVEDERIYKVEVPERAGALDKFLAAVSPAFQITMTHYRSDGGQVGNCLFGMKASQNERAQLEEAIKSTGYVFEDLTSNSAYNMLYGCQRVGACSIRFDEDEA